MKFFEHFALITDGIATKRLWDATDGFFYDLLVAADGQRIALRVKSLVGVIPVFAAVSLADERRSRARGCTSGLPTSWSAGASTKQTSTDWVHHSDPRD